MNFEEKQFEQFHMIDFAKSVEAFRVLHQFFGEQRGIRFSEEPQSFRSMVRDIADIAEMSLKETSEDYPYVQEKSVLEMFDMDTVTTFTRAWSAWVDAYSQTGEAPHDEETSYRMVLVSEIASFAKKFDVLPESIDFLTNQYNTLSDIAKKNVSMMFVELENSGNDILSQIEHLGAFLKVSTVQPYTKKEFEDVLAGDISTYEGPRLAATVRYLLDNGEGIALSNIAYEHLHVVGIYKKPTYAWDEALYLTILLHTPFLYFRQLHWEFQEFWLTFYFVKAQIAGVPLTHLLQDYLYNETSTLLDYATENIFLLKSLDKNQEIIPLGIDGVNITLGALCKEYMLRLGDKFNDGYRREEYIEEHVASAEHKGLWKHVLRKILYIYAHLKSVDLIEKNRGSEPSEKEIYDTQIEHLLTWWIDEDFWDLIAEYFMKAHETPAVVPLGSLVSNIQKNESLEDPKIQDKAVRFNEFLREKGVLKEEQDIVIYNEQRGRFEWNHEW